jgi:glutathione peroxidase
MNKIVFIVLLAITSLTVAGQSSIYDFTLTSASGSTIDFNNYRGKKILIVNTASQSEQANQLALLQQLYTQYGTSLVVIAIPSNDFSNELKTNSEIASSYNVTFPIAAKSSITGSGIIPLYSWLTKKTQNGFLNTEMKTDFQKFLISSTGTLIGVFSGDIKPNSRFITSAITQ